MLLIADLIWQLAKAYIEFRLELTGHGSSADELARNGRLRTLLPIFRNALAVFIAVVAVLTILAGLGIQIMPLIAGAGIFGVAIGFGSQTLVKDILSGVFYMLDDAFRVGEYIQSGSYKGTVELFSLRSVRLRHQARGYRRADRGRGGGRLSRLSEDGEEDRRRRGAGHRTSHPATGKFLGGGRGKGSAGG